MALRIRLRKQGRTNRPFFRLVVTDGRSPRDGRYMETLGWYNPLEAKEELHMSVKADRVQHWIDQGAQMSDKAEALVARAAPEVVKGVKARIAARQAKLTAKKRARRKAAK